MKPKLDQFSLQTLFLLLTGISCVFALGAVGGRYWFLFGAMVFWSVVGLTFGFRWALYSHGYWPTGLLGRLLFFATLLMLPLLLVLLTQVFLDGLGTHEAGTWWKPPTR